MNEISVIIDGIRSPLLELGPADSNEAVVFVHGNPGSIRDWDALARGVGEFGRAMAIDMCKITIDALFRLGFFDFLPLKMSALAARCHGRVPL
jgi:pimeloyl-ACP methyl ester carboxylesterase